MGSRTYARGGAGEGGPRRAISWGSGDSRIAGVAVHRRQVKPVKVRLHDPQLRCEVSRVVGYRAECECGWKSATCETFALARETWRAHVTAYGAGGGGGP